MRKTSINALLHRLFNGFGSLDVVFKIVLSAQIVMMVFFIIISIVSYILLFHESYTTPVGNPLPSAISGSSDAWASLVANVAPLLVLVGEKHVKAYFKSMSKQSHFLLYAVSPIGLITTIVTLIRLHGTPFMKKVIGRQFETRAEVLADVTSVSYNGVGLEYQDNGLNHVLEQTIFPSSEDEARVGIYLSISGTGRVHNKAIHNHIDLFRSYDEALAGIPGLIRWYTIDIVRVRGENAARRFRDLAACMINIHGATLRGLIDSSNSTDYFAPYDGEIPEIDVDDQVRKRRYDECSILSTTHLDGPGLSPSIAPADVSRGQGLSRSYMETVRISASIICVLRNVVIITLDALSQEETLTVALIAIGTSMVFFTSLASTTVIARAAKLHNVSLKEFDVLSAGVFSATKPMGVSLKLPLPSITISVPNPQIKKAWLMVVLVTGSAVAYVSLYLGLRVAVWWVPLAMLGNSVLAACFRTVATSGTEIDVPSLNKMSKFTKYRSRNELCFLLVVQNKTILDNVSEPQSVRCDQEDSETFVHEKRRQPQELEDYTLLAIGGPNVSPKSNGFEDEGNKMLQNTLLANAYAIVEALHATRYRLRRPNDIHSGEKSSLRSEFVGADGVWHQNFDILIQLTDDSRIPSDLSSRIKAILRIWITQAFLGDHEFNKSTDFALPRHSVPSTSALKLALHGPNYPFLKHQGPQAAFELIWLQREARKTAISWCAGEDALHTSWTTTWSHKAMLWMAVKIIFSVQFHVPDEDFRAMLVQERTALWDSVQSITPHQDGEAAVESMRKRQALGKGTQCSAEVFVPWYVDCLIATGLAVR